jgi:pyruvate dehydrogenase E2 component (dihydrolipoamide acetyltransferase)
MAIPITVPRLGWNMEEGTFAGWLKREGDAVRAGEALFRLESDKATEEIESLDSGILRIADDAPREGDVVKVGAVIAHLLEKGESSSLVVSRSLPEPLTSVPPPQRGEASKKSNPSSLRGEGRKTASPRARRVAKRLGLDWTTLSGTGRNGRVRERDVLAASPTVFSAPALPPTRRTIARRMLEGHLTTAPVTLTTTADATNLVNLRRQFKAVGDAPSYNDFLLALTAQALRQHPSVNAHWSDDRPAPCPDIHLGLAVETEQGLLVPVVRDVPAKSLKQLVPETRTLIERARHGKLRADEMQGGTFTVTSLGAYGIDAFTPLLNPPQVGILGVGRIQRRPAVVGEKITAKEQITLSLTFDHRAIDGAPAARFLQTLVGLIENPAPALVS